MPEVAVYAPGTVNWVDLASKDLEVSKKFYSKLFGWQPNTIPDPQAGGYTMFLVDGKQVGALGPTQDAMQPASAWTVYFATEDANKTAKAVKDAGGKVIAEPMDVMGQGTMAVFQDPNGAFFAVWQPGIHKGFELLEKPGTYAWAELNTRGIDKVKPFYQKVFGWGIKTSPMGPGMPDYTEWQVDGTSIGGGVEMMHPPSVPPHWLVYFSSPDVDASTKKVAELGGSVMLEPHDFPGGRFSIVTDPQGGAFGILAMRQA